MPETPPVTVIQETLWTAVQSQPEAVVRVTDPEAPEAAAEAEVDPSV